MYGHDHDIVPFIPTGFAGPTGFITGSPATFSGGFIQADYMAYPWLMMIMRWDRVQSRADFLNEAGALAPTNYFSSAGSTRNRFTPGAQFLIHANVKASFEYAYRPQQALTYNLNGQPMNVFRTNTATGALEFVY